MLIDSRNRTGSGRSTVRRAVFAAVFAVSVMLVPGVGHAQTDSLYAPFTNCPLHEPAMWNAGPSTFGTGCFTATTNDGSFRIGGTTVPITHPVDVQFGYYGDEEGGHVVTPDSGAVSAQPETVPGGLLGLMCPSGIPVVSSLCDRIVNDPNLNGVTAEVVSAGDIRDFTAEGVFNGRPVFTMPVKIRLYNILLGEQCYIGSDSEPILLSPQWGTTDPPPPNEPATGVQGDISATTDPEASQVTVIAGTEFTLVDNSFGVPEAHGCGPFGLANFAVNLKQGLPSAPGNNAAVLADTDSYLALDLASPYPARHLAGRIEASQG